MADVEQTLALKLEALVSEFRRDLDQAAKSANELAGEVGSAGDRMDRDLKGVQDSASRTERSFDDLAGKAGTAAGVVAGAFAGGAIVGTFDDSAQAAGRLRAQLGLTAEEAVEFDEIAKQVYRDNFGDSMQHAAEVAGLVHQSLGLTGDELATVTEGVFAVEDAFGHVGADVQIITEDIRTMRSNFPGLTEKKALDLIARGFQDGTGAAGDLQDTLQEYPGDFARLGLTAEDMLGLLTAGMDAGVRNTDVLADAVRELGIRVSTAGDTGQEALAKMFPEDEAERLIRDMTAGGEAGRDAFFTILDGLTAVQDPQDRYNLSVELLGTKGEELANQLPGMRDALHDVRDGTLDADGAAATLNEQYAGMSTTFETWKRSLQTSVLGPAGDVVGAMGEAGFAVAGLVGGLQVAGVDMGKALGGLRTGLRNVVGYLTGPWGIAIAGAVAAIAIFEGSKQRAADAVEAFRGTLDTETGALTENTRAHAVNRLEQLGALQAAQTLGIELDVLTDAVLGETDALEEVDRALRGETITKKLSAEESARWHEAANDVHETVAALSGELEGSVEKQRRMNEALGEGTENADALDAAGQRLTDDPIHVRFAIDNLEGAQAALDVMQALNRTAGINVRAELSGGQVGARAAGGPVSHGAYLVGEKGPELLVLGPQTSGYVYPSGSPQVTRSTTINQTINAPSNDPLAIARTSSLALMATR